MPKRLTPLQAIRAECRYCMNSQYSLITECPSQETCNLWPYRLGKMPKHGERRPLKAMRRHCMECVGGKSWKDVQECTGKLLGGGQCPIWPYRFGKRPGTRARFEKLKQTALRDGFQPEKATKTPGLYVGVGQGEINDSSAENAL